MSRKHRDRSWPPADAVAPLAGPVTDNHTHLPVGGPSGAAPAPDDAAAPAPKGDAPGAAPAGAAPDAAELVRRAAAVGVTRVITSACETAAWEGSLELARDLAGVRVAAAIHPNEAVAHAGVREVGPDGLEPLSEPHHAEPLDEAMSRLEGLVRAHRGLVVAVGETGLDYFRAGERGRAVQREAFRAHIALAKELGLPLQIHDRDAHEDCVAVLEADGAPERTVFHCFSGGPRLAAACAEHGWYASVAGPVTYPANEELRRVVAALPAELLLVETDAPYLPPKPWRGRPNASYLMGATVRFLARLRGIDEERMCSLLAVSNNTVYGMW